jgi:hypothetical protein
LKEQGDGGAGEVAGDDEGNRASSSTKWTVLGEWVTVPTLWFTAVACSPCLLTARWTIPVKISERPTAAAFREAILYKHAATLNLGSTKF